MLWNYAANSPAVCAPPPDRTPTFSPLRQLPPCRRTLASPSSAACSSRPSTRRTPRQDSRTGCLPMVTSSFGIKTCLKIHLELLLLWLKKLFQSKSSTLTLRPQQWSRNPRICPFLQVHTRVLRYSFGLFHLLPLRCTEIHPSVVAIIPLQPLAVPAKPG